MLISMLGGVMQATPEEMASTIFDERVTPFMTKCKPRPRLTAKIGDQLFEFKKKTKRNGRCEQWFLLEPETVSSLTDSDSGTIDFEVSVPDVQHVPA